MGNPTNQQRLEQIETDLEKMKDHFSDQVAALEERMSKKQDNTDKTLAQLLEGQMKLLEKHTTMTQSHTGQKEVNQRRMDNVEREKMNMSYNDRQERGNNGGNWKYRKLDLTPFNGVDSDDWIMKAEKYFSFYGLDEQEKVEATVVCMEGEALMWYRWERQRTPMDSWKNLKELILRHFRPSDEGDLYEQWLSVEQWGSVAEYRREFVSGVNNLEPVPEAILIGAFLRGLQENIKELRVLGPTTLEQTMDWAERVDRKLGSTSWMGRRIGTGNSSRAVAVRPKSLTFPNPNPNPNSNTLPNYNPNQTLAITYPTNNYPPQERRRTDVGGGRGEPVRRLMPSEVRERREMGLCFQCDGKWSRNPVL